MLILAYRPLLAYAFDPAFAVARGLPTLALDLATLLLVALTVVVLMRVTGLILLMAMLTIPPALAGRLTRTAGEPWLLLA